MSDAHRKMKMNELLSEGGFPAEALAPIGEAFELSLKACAIPANGEHLAEEENLPLAFIRSYLVSSGLLPDDAIATVAGVRQAVTNPQSLCQEYSLTLMAPARQPIDQVEKAVNRTPGQ